MIFQVGHATAFVRRLYSSRIDQQCHCRKGIQNQSRKCSRSAARLSKLLKENMEGAVSTLRR